MCYIMFMFFCIVLDVLECVNWRFDAFFRVF